MWYFNVMKMILFFLISAYSITAKAEDLTNELQKGDCFEYKQSVGNKKLKWIVGKVESLNLGTWDLEGTLFAKTEKNDKKIKFVKFHFVTSYKNRFKYKKINCPNNLPNKKGG
jgi:hypothetical protein